MVLVYQPVFDPNSDEAGEHQLVTEAIFDDLKSFSTAERIKSQ